MARIVILGYYGFRNTGDEALLAAIAASLRRHRPDAELAVLTAAGDGLPDRGLTPVNRWHPLRVAAALRRADLLVAGGGTLLQDATSLRSLAYYVSVVLLARLLGTRVMLYANGLGPLRTAPGRWLARLALAAADAVTMRDTRSLEAVRTLYPDLAGKATLAADPALLLEPAADGRAGALLAEAGVGAGRPLVAACVRPWPGVAYEPALAAALDRVAREHGTATLFLPMQLPGDAAACRRVMAHMRSPAHLLARPVSPQVFMALLGHARAVAAMRLHAAVLAAAVGVPALGLAYDPKVEGVLADLGLPSLGRPEDLAPAPLAAALDDLLRRREAVSGALRRRLAELRPRAEASAAVAASLLGP